MVEKDNVTVLLEVLTASLVEIRRILWWQLALLAAIVASLGIPLVTTV